jgi:hypothetical protein
MKHKLKICWEHFWYNDVTRLVLLLGGHMIIILPVMLLFGAGMTTIHTVGFVTWLLLYIFMAMDNGFVAPTKGWPKSSTEKCDLLNSTKKEPE